MPDKKNPSWHVNGYQILAPTPKTMHWFWQGSSPTWTTLRFCVTDAFPWGAGHGTLRWTRASEQAGKALRSQGHQCTHVM